jgi:hypothetical protein
MMDTESDRLVRALADRVLRLAVVLERIQPDLASLRGTFEGVVVHEIRMALSQIREGIGLAVSNTKDAERAAHAANAEAKATREVTGSFRTQKPESKSGKLAAVGKAMLKARAGTLLSLAVLALAAAVAVAVGAAVYQRLSSVLGAHGG